jgi:starch-binding outer membrane protein, SusD/RagB family
MKNIKIIMSLIALTVIFNACDKEFLDRSPLDQVGSVDYFKSPTDLRAYVNQYYNSTSFPISEEWGRDFDSDNAVATNVNAWLEGTRTLDGAGGVSFSRVRSINYFFDNYKRVEKNANFADYKQFLGEAYFFRALIYFSLLQSYGDIQWYTTEIGTASPELYKARDPRNIVADNIIANLDSAAMYLTEAKTNGASRINKWMALLLQSRVALFEGTWQKYHAGTPFGVSNPQPAKYFNKVVEAATKVMESGLYDIYSTGKPSSDYYDLFILRSYSTNKEVMFWKEFNNALGKGEVIFRRQPNYMQQHPYERSFTKQLADSYLCIDGNPISISPLFQGHASLTDEMQNRDPRFYQTISTPDAVWRIHPNGTINYFKELYDRLNTGVQYNSPGGYLIRKGYNPNLIYHVPQYEETPAIIYRYAEVLLNYAEAKAELGTITQADIDKSIKKLRDRVGMPNLILANIAVDPKWDFPTLSPAINEIRRERRVELASEGLRAADIKRWAAAGELIVGKRPKGFLAAQVAINPYPVGADGFLDPYLNKIPNGYGFKLNRDYLDAIPKTQMGLNPNLIQNPGWE